MTTQTFACATHNLSVAYHLDPVLEQVNVRFPEGAIMGIVGPNGAGKSTLIKAMLGLIPTLTGETEFFGQPLKAVRHRVGYMPQHASVDWDFPTTVLDVVTMGTYGSLGWFRRAGKRERAAAYGALERVGMQDFASRQIGALSGGQRQRVFLARGLVQDPDLFFLDEPFQGIDAKSEATIIDVLRDMREAGTTMVMVHHDLATVPTYCDAVTLLDKTVIASGPVSTTFTPEMIAKTYGLSADSMGLLGVL